MSATWYGDRPPTPPRFGIAGWCRILLKTPILAVVIFSGLLLMLVVRLFERPLCGVQRPVTPFITVVVCRMTLGILGLSVKIIGTPDTSATAVVANHSSWLDIFALNARKRVYFVSKAEVAGWPGIGWLARATGTVFIERNPKKATEQKAVFQERIAAGHRLLFFPEGTSSDGQRVLPFKSTLFAAFFEDQKDGHIGIQPVSLFYRAPQGQDHRFFGWWGDMDFGSHFLRVVALGAGGEVSLSYQPLITVQQAPTRKAMAQACETAVRQGFEGQGS